MTTDQQPLAITLGEPAGVGPELIAALWRQRASHNLEPFMVVGAIEALALYLDADEMIAIQNPGDAHRYFEGRLPVLDIPLAEPPCAGKLNPANAAAVVEAIRVAAALAQSGKTRGLVTGPIHKAVLRQGPQGNFAFTGHTDFLADCAGLTSDQVVMMFISDDFRVAPLTHHLALREVPSAVTGERIKIALRIIARSLGDDFGLSSPRIAVCGLNPHAGESGEFGREEIEIIRPAIDEMRQHGLHIDGPFAADSLFRPEFRCAYDAILAMYHDQALTPVKALGFGKAVNLTLGLPYIRTSPDHGTALDIAGNGTANVDGFLAAIKLAERLGSNRAGRISRVT